MVFPTTVYDGYVAKQNCPKGFKHVPHLFYEMYWNTIDFKDRWTPNQGEQPFVLANGDLSGCSGHGDFLAAWDTDVLQNIIDTCNAGDAGMNLCPGVTVRDQSTSCNVASPIDEVIKGKLSSLPGSNPLVGWGMSEGGSSAATNAPVVSSSSGSKTSSGSPSPARGSGAASSSAAAQVISPSEDGGTNTSPSSASSSATTTAAPTTTTAPAVVAAEKVATSAATSATVTTLPDGRVHTTTVVDWVTLTKWVTEAAPVATQTVQANNNAHVHAHAHMFRHRSAHHRKW